VHLRTAETRSRTQIDIRHDALALGDNALHTLNGDIFALRKLEDVLLSVDD
jgi:hypothetical protein